MADTIDRSKVKADIVKWKPRKEDIIAEPDGKLFIVHFEKVFTAKKNLENLGIFIITKNSYDKQLKLYCHFQHLCHFHSDTEMK